MNKRIVEQFGLGNYIEYGINFKNKTLLIAESSPYAPEACTVSSPTRVIPAVLEEIEKVVGIPYGDSYVIGDVTDDGIIFELKQIRRRIKGGRKNYGYY